MRDWNQFGKLAKAVFFCLLSIPGLSQPKEFSSIIKFPGPNTLEVFLSCDGYLISEKCATYRRIMPVDNDLRIDGIVEDYTTSGVLVGQTRYEKGVRNGSVKGFYGDGSPRFEGQYFNNIHYNVWKFYYPDGTLEKIIRYENGIPRLMHFSNEKGKILVRNGTGTFNGVVMITKLSCNEYKVSGAVRNGFMHGKWTVLDQYSEQIIYRENYTNGRFIEGKYVNMPNSPTYIDQPKSTYVGFQVLENAYYFADVSCAENPKFSMYNGSRNLEESFYPELISRLELDLKMMPSVSGRSLVNITLDSTGVDEIDIYSTLEDDVQKILTSSLKEMTGWNTEYITGKENRFFIIVINDGKVLIPAYSQAATPSNEETVADIVDFEMGETKNGQKVGIWDYYNSKGELELKVDYDKPRIMFFKPDTSKYLVQQNGKWIETYVERPTMYLGSSKIFHDDMTNELRYPKQALKDQITGTSLMSLEVRPDGYAENLKIIEDIGGNTKSIVESALNKVDNIWIPAVKDGKAVRSMIYISVDFHLNDPGTVQFSRRPYVHQFRVIADAK